MLYAKFGWNSPGSSGKEDFLKLSICICNKDIFQWEIIAVNLLLSPPRKWCDSFIWTIIIMFYSKFGWKCPSVSGEEYESLQTDGQTDRRQMIGDQIFYSFELKNPWDCVQLRSNDLYQYG